VLYWNWYVRIIAIEGSRRMWKEAVVACSKTLSWHLSLSNSENHETRRLKYAVSGLTWNQISPLYEADTLPLYQYQYRCTSTGTAVPVRYEFTENMWSSGYSFTKPALCFEICFLLSLIISLATMYRVWLALGSNSVWASSGLLTILAQGVSGFPHSLQADDEIVPSKSHDHLLPNSYLLIIRYHPGSDPRLRVAQTGGPTDRCSVLYPPFLCDNESRIQLSKGCDFII
jgi:hypothetical protein